MKKLLFPFALACALAWPTFSWSQTIETGFSPEAGAQALVIKVIDSARSSIHLAAYSFTSPQVVQALLNAKRRGVDVSVLADEKGNHSKASMAALNLVAQAGIPTRTISAYTIHHDKYIIVDGVNVETGSFNYSTSAANGNSENVIVIWGSREVASEYEAHWQSRWALGKIYSVSY